MDVTDSPRNRRATPLEHRGRRQNVKSAVKNRSVNASKQPTSAKVAQSVEEQMVSTASSLGWPDFDANKHLDSDPSDEPPQAPRALANRPADALHPSEPPASSQPAPDTPPADQIPASSNKKKTNVHPKKKGRNQYTKDRDSHLRDDSPARSMSRDLAREKDETFPKSNHDGGPRHTKSKGAMNPKISMTDLKRRANNLMEFLTRTQVELANEPLSERNSPRQTASEAGTSDSPISLPNGGKSSTVAEQSSAVTNGISTPPVKDFKEMSCVEMMDALSRDLVKWQREFIA